MSLDFQTNETNFLSYILFTVDGTEYRWGTRYEELDDDTIIEGGLVGLSRLNSSAGEITDPRVLFPSLTVFIDNRPEEDGSRVQDLLEDFEWANAPAELIIGQGKAAATYEPIFTGFIAFPGGVGWTDAAVSFLLTDDRAKDSRFLPTESYTADDYPDMDANFINTGRPVLIGDFRSTVEGVVAIRAIQIDDTVGTGGKFEISMYAVKELEDVLLNDTPVSFSSVDLDAASFVLDVSFNPLTDVVTVYALGATDDNTSAGDAVELPPEVFSWILQYPMEVDVANINATAIADWLANMDPTKDKMHRRISDDEHSDDILSSILSEGFADLGMEGNAYYPRYRILSLSTTSPQLMEEDIAPDVDNDRLFSGMQDPPDIYCNEVVAFFQLNPSTGIREQRKEQADETAVTAKGQRIRRTLYFDFLYREDGVVDRIARELMVFSGDPELVEMTSTEAGVVLRATEQMRLVYNKYTADSDGFGVPFQVRNIDIDAFNLAATMTLWNILRLGAGTWTENIVITWIISTTAQQREKGYWTDVDGFADTTIPPDPGSKRYRWI